MRIVSAVFCILTLVFAIAQYNDPDALYWGMIYGVAAIWCGLAALRPARLARIRERRLLTATMILAAAGVAWYWPKTPEFWRKDVWWVTETAREGMGMMIVFVALVAAWLVGRNRSLSP